MKIELAVTGLCWFALAFGQTTIGLRWVLPNLTEGRLPGTPFGPPALTLAMVRFSWHITSVLLLGFGVLFAVLAVAPNTNPTTVLLRWFGLFALAAAALAIWNARRHPRSLVRLPVPFVLAAIAAMSWLAST